MPVPGTSNSHTGSLQVAKVSLNPARRPKKPAEPAPTKPVKQDKPSGQTSLPSAPAEPPKVPTKEEGGDSPRSPPPKVLNIVRSSKFRHIDGQMMHRSTHIDKVPKLSSTVPGDSNAYQVEPHD